MGLSKKIKRILHMFTNHPFDTSELIDVLESERHPESNSDRAFVVNIYRCNGCGLTYLETGMQTRGLLARKNKQN